MVNTTETASTEDARPSRLRFGEAYMFCRSCGARLYSFEGTQDQDRPCPTPGECSTDEPEWWI